MNVWDHVLTFEVAIKQKASTFFSIPTNVITDCGRLWIVTLRAFIREWPFYVSALLLSSVQSS